MRRSPRSGDAHREKDSRGPGGFLSDFDLILYEDPGFLQSQCHQDSVRTAVELGQAYSRAVGNPQASRVSRALLRIRTDRAGTRAAHRQDVELYRCRMSPRLDAE